MFKYPFQSLKYMQSLFVSNFIAVVVVVVFVVVDIISEEKVII